MIPTYDFYFEAVPEGHTGFKFFTRKYDRAIAVTGVAKLLNTWTKMFLTVKGSDPTNLDGGTDFAKLMGSNIESQQDLRDVTLLSISDCNAQIKSIQRMNPVEDSAMLQDATLLNFEQASPDRIDVWIGITNMQNTSATILVPLINP